MSSDEVFYDASWVEALNGKSAARQKKRLSQVERFGKWLRLNMMKLDVRVRPWRYPRRQRVGTSD